MLSNDIDYFVKQAFSSLELFKAPSWTNITDHNQPVFRYYSGIFWKLIADDLSPRKVKTGDKFEVVVTISPIVRLDNNILVMLGGKNPRVIREIDGKQSLITGLAAFAKTHSAKLALDRDSRIKVKITSIFECTSIYPKNHYKQVGGVKYQPINL